jgi:hypothetical protein
MIWNQHKIPRIFIFLISHTGTRPRVVILLENNLGSYYFFFELSLHTGMLKKRNIFKNFVKSNKIFFANMKTVLQIRDVYPGSRILIFTHPGSRIQKQQ